MPKITTSVFVATLLALGANSAPAHAQQARSFVSGLGNDGNAPNCTRTAPCRTFQVAHNNTLAAGEITVLDPGSYGSLIITKNISIINDGVGEAGALVSGGGTGIAINAGPNDRVSLRGLTIKGIGFGGGNGIVFNSGRFLSIENCAIRNLTGNAQSATIGHGVIFTPNSASEFAMSHTVVTDNDGHGIAVVPVDNNIDDIKVVFNRVEAYKNNAHGIVFAMDTSNSILHVAVESSVSAFNGASGFDATASNVNLIKVLMNITRSVSAGNQTGVSSGPGGVVMIGQSNITGNINTWTGPIESYGDNYVRLNGDNDPAAPGGITTKK